MNKNYKTETRKMTVREALEFGYSDLVGLGEEMRERAENMEGANMGHMTACTQASEAADALEDLEAPELPEVLGLVEVEVHQLVNRRKGRSESRAVRLQNACAYLEAVKEAADRMAGHLEDEIKEGKREDDGQREACETFRDELDEVSGNAGAVEFPSMYTG